MTTRKKLIDFNLNEYDFQFLPHSEKLEQSVLGIMIDFKDAFAEGMKYLNIKGMFYEEINNDVWMLLLKFSAENIEISRESVKLHYEGLRDKKMSAYVHTLLREYDVPTYFQGYCLKLNEYWITRTIARMGHYLNQEALKQGNDSLDLLSVANSSISKIILHISKMKEKTLEDGAEELIKELVSAANSPNGILGLPSSLKGINSRIKGYRNGNLIIIGAGTNEGKSTLAFQEIRHMAESGIPVGVFSLEMKISEMFLLMACSRLGIDSERALSGQITPDEWAKFDAEIKILKSLPIKISETAGMKISEIEALTSMWVNKHGVKVVFVDHIHITRHENDALNPEQKYTDIANRLKVVAKANDIPVIALSQFARKDEQGGKKPHKITDIKYAGGIEQAADVILMIFRPEHWGINEDEDGKSTKGFAKIIVGKLRLLPKKDIICHFTGMQFLDNAPTTYFIPEPSFENPYNSFKGKQPQIDTIEQAPF